MTASNVAIPSSTVMTAETKRQLLRDLMGGTDAMRAAGEKYLPREYQEAPDAYATRLARTFLFNGTGETVKDLVGRVFAREITLESDVPADIVAWAENIDMAGRDLNVFARDCFQDAIVNGITYILTDMAPKPDRTLTKAEANALNRRPWLVNIKTERVLGWKSTNVNGSEILTQFRFQDDQTEADGDFGEKSVDQVKVFVRDGDTVTWQTWRKGQKGDWLIYEEGPISLPYIPVAPIYANRCGFMNGHPPLSDLAEVNLQHWQSQSDQRNILHVARVPILFWAGATMSGEPTVIGPGRVIASSDPASKLSYVEHSGNAIGAGDKDLANLEAQMQALGLDLLIAKTVAQSATGAVIDAGRVTASLAMMADALEDGIENALQAMANYAGLGDGGSADVNKDYTAGLANDAATIIQARSAGIISNATAIRELQRRRTLSDNIDAEDETIAALEEGFADPAQGADALTAQ